MSAAFAFGFVTPLLRVAAEGAGPFSTAMLLDAGAYVVSLRYRRGSTHCEAPLESGGLGSRTSIHSKSCGASRSLRMRRIWDTALEARAAQRGDVVLG